MLAERASVSLLTFSDREPVVPELENVYEKIITVPRDGGYTASKIVQGALGKTPLPILNYTSPSMKAARALPVSAAPRLLVIRGLNVRLPEEPRSRASSFAPTRYSAPNL